MTRRSVILLVLALAVLVAILLVNRMGRDRNPDQPELLLSGLQQELSAVEKVTVRGANNRDIATLEQQDGVWVVRQRHDYPADTAKLRAMLQALASAKTIEKKTATETYYPRLGVEGLDSEDAGGVGVRVASSRGDYDVILGKSNGEYRYVRLVGDAQSWLIDQNPDVEDDTTAWLAGEILDLESARMQSVTITHPDGESIAISRPSRDDDFTVDNLPAGRELQYAGIADGIANALSGLTLDDVAPASDDTQAPVVTQYRTFDGVEVTVRSVERGDETWSGFSLREVADAGDETAGSDPGPDDAAESESEEAAPEPIDVDALNDRLGGWQYRLAGYKADAITRRWEDILKAVEEDGNETD